MLRASSTLALGAITAGGRAIPRTVKVAPALDVPPAPGLRTKATVAMKAPAASEHRSKNLPRVDDKGIRPVDLEARILSVATQTFISLVAMRF